MTRRGNPIRNTTGKQLISQSDTNTLLQTMSTCHLLEFMVQCGRPWVSVAAHSIRVKYRHSIAMPTISNYPLRFYPLNLPFILSVSS